MGRAQASTAKARSGKFLTRHKARMRRIDSAIARLRRSGRAASRPAKR